MTRPSTTPRDRLAERREKMKPVKMWAVISRESPAIHVCYTRKHARSVQNYMGYPPAWRIARVRIIEEER